MPPIVPPLAAVFVAIPDPRSPRGRRHPLVAILLLACVAMLAGARGRSGIADWAKNHGEPWRTRLGFRRPKGPSQPTLHRVFAHLALATLEAQLAQWAQQVVVALADGQDEGADDALVFLHGVALDGRRCG